MTPHLLLPPEIAISTPPGWTVASAVLIAVLLTTGLTLASFSSFLS